MQIHRTVQRAGFTVLPNVLLQDRRLSYVCRGLLVDLLSRPDGWREDGRHMADSSPQGRLAVARALRELTAAGYYRVVKVRQPDGTFVSEAHVWDTPQLGTPGVVLPGVVRPGVVLPGAVEPGSGAAAARVHGANPVKNLEKEPTLPAVRSEASDPATAEAVAVLFRVLRPEPRLRLGPVEALALAPLVQAWLGRGSTAADLGNALLPGLPARLHSAAALLRDRLTRKMPPLPAPEDPAVVRTECGSCGIPLREPGTCRPCAGLGDRPVKVGCGEAATARGAALVRAALRGGGGREPAPYRAAETVMS